MKYLLLISVLFLTGCQENYQDFPPRSIKKDVWTYLGRSTMSGFYKYQDDDVTCYMINDRWGVSLQCLPKGIKK